MAKNRGKNTAQPDPVRSPNWEPIKVVSETRRSFSEEEKSMAPDDVAVLKQMLSGIQGEMMEFNQRLSTLESTSRHADLGNSSQEVEGMEHLLQRVEQWMHDVEQWVRQQPVEQLYAALAVLLLTIALLLLGRLFKRTKSNTIVLAGLSGSGKTVLFYQLRDGSFHHGTVTSMEPNDDCFILHSESEKKNKIKPVRIVDVPGHPRLRTKLDDFLPQAAGIVFVVDALDFLPSCRAIAEYLYDILTKANVVKKKIPVLILCNKADKVTAHSKEFIKKQLEKEIDKLRTSRTGLSTADITNEYTLGEQGETFSFVQCHNKVSVADAAGLMGETSQLEQFIREHVKL